MADIYEHFKNFKSFEVTFVNENGEPKKLFCNIKSIENNTFVIEADNKSNKNAKARVNDELKLYIYTESGIYSAVSRVLEVTDHNKLTEYVVEYPSESKHSQRREYFRADLGVKFKMEILPENNTDAKTKVNAITKNICGKGMSYITDRQFPKLEVVQIDLLFDEKVVKTPAKLVYSKQIVIANKPKYVHAFTFTDISQKDIDYIVKKCFLYQLDVRKKEKINLF